MPHVSITAGYHIISNRGGSGCMTDKYKNSDCVLYYKIDVCVYLKRVKVK